MSLLERSAAQERPVVVQFHAKWCGPCKALAPQVARMEEEFRDRVDVWRVDVDEDPGSAREAGVRGVPTLLALRGGREVARRTGFIAGDTLRDFFRAALSGEEAPTGAPDDAVFDAALRVAAGLGLQWISGLAPSAHFLSWAGLAVLFWGMRGFCPSCRVPAPRRAGTPAGEGTGSGS